MEDLQNDQEVGFELISTDDIDDLGVVEIVRRIRERVGDSPVYLRYETFDSMHGHNVDHRAT